MTEALWNNLHGYAHMLIDEDNCNIFPIYKCLEAIL